MEQVDQVPVRHRSRWRSFVNFPLVTLLLAVLIYIVAMAAALLFAQKVLPPITGLTQQMKAELVAIPLLILVYKFVISRLGEHKRDDLRGQGAAREVSLGVGLGVLIFVISVAIAALLGIYRIVGQGDTSGLLPALLSAALFPAFNEEILFRGILFRWIEEFGGSWAALIVTSVFFGAAHLFNPNASPIAAFGIALEAGLLLGAAYMLTRSLWLPIGIHAAWNFTQGEVFDIPVSGTAVHGLVDAQLTGPPLLTGNGFGLEASVITIVVATAFGVWMLMRAIRAGELIKPWWVRRRIAREGVVEA
jgi:membrane protease YdiL (CAAX protease family)